MNIALKETNETDYWLSLLKDTGYINWSTPHYELPYGIKYFDIANNPDSVFQIVNENAPYSETFKNTMQIFFESISEDTIACEMINKIHIFEDTVATSELYSSDENNCLMSVFAVAKYSIVFWWDYYDLYNIYNSISYNPKEGGSILEKRKFRSKAHANAFAITTTDFVGAYIGFLGGCIGMNPVAMAVGAILGGVGGSAYAGFLAWLGI